MVLRVRVLKHLGDAEVAELEVAVIEHEDVGRLVRVRVRVRGRGRVRVRVRVRARPP